MSIFKKLFGDKKQADTSIKTPPAFKVRENDIFLVSYPKSGNTWARFLIGNYLTNGAFTFLNSNDLIPDMHAHPEKCEAITDQRIIKSHFSYRADFNKVIYIVRDPRDVAVSYYYYYLKYVYNKIESKPEFHDFFKLFMSGNVEFGLWDSHVNSWSNVQRKNVLVLRYEDFIVDTTNCLQKMITFIYGSFDDKLIKTAVEASRFEKMAEMEQLQRSRLPRNAASDSSIPFVRKGEPGNFIEYFSEMELSQITSKFGGTMERFNY